MEAHPKHNVGIVLSGGGTRGIAHIGVLRALGEHGVFPQCIAGASAGAIVGALYAARYTPAQMLEFFELKNPFRLSKVAIAKPGIIDTAKVVSDFEEYFPDNSFESLDKELRVIATDLTRGEPVEFHSGPLIPAVLASSSVPVMFTPMEHDGRIFADGGIVSSFPAELLGGRCRSLLGVYTHPMGPTDSGSLKSSLSVLKRALEVGMFQVSQSKFDRCDIVIRPPKLERIGVFETKNFAAIEAAGYEEAIERMPEILEIVRRNERDA